MLLYRRTSVFESSAQTLVNTVNCVGVMGKGVAKVFKDREPEMFRAYKKICDAKLLEPGRLWLWKGATGWVLNFPTKLHWKQPSRLEWIEAGLAKFVNEYEARGITDISFPLLGCGNGGLDWGEVRPIMEHHLARLPIPVYIHDHTVDVGLPEHLERVAQRLREEAPRDLSFWSVLDAIYRTVDIAGDDLRELRSERPFSVARGAENTLVLDNGQGTIAVEPEQVRAIWTQLINGLVTRERVDKAVEHGAGPLITMLSLLPQARAVEVQRAESEEAELAVEVRPIPRAVATNALV